MAINNKSNNMGIKVSELLIEKQESGSTVKIFNEKIPFPKEDGCFFGILEIEHPGQNILLDHTIRQFKNNFPKIINKKNNIEEIFEQVLQDVNQNLTNYIKEKNILMDFEKFNGVIAILNGKNLYFTYLGKVAALLIHKIGKDNYKVIDILDTISGSTSKPTVFKIFSNIISGHIQDEDSVFFGTSNILNFTTPERIKNLAVNFETATVMLEIKNLLDKLEKNINFGSILLKLSPPKKDNSDKCDYVITNVSENDESDTKEEEEEEEDTEKQKKDKQKEASSITKQIKEAKKYMGEKFISPKEDAEKKIEEEALDEKLDYVEETMIEPEKIIAKITPEKPNKIAEKISNQMNRTKNKFFSLKRASQILFLVIIAATVFFFQSLKNKSKQNLIIQNEKKYTENIELIENKLTQAKAKLIINEKDEAKNIIENAKTLISELPKDQDKEEKINDLNKQAQSYLDQIRNITKIDNPNIVAELANPASHLIKQKDAIYLYNSDNSLYKLDLTKKEIKAVASKINDAGSWQKNAPDAEEGKTLFLYDGSGISQYDFTTNELSNIKIDLIKNARIDDLFFYGQKLYIIYGSNNKIYKYVKLDKNSFNSGSNWLIKDADLNNAVSMAIDGNIWVLKNTGEIVKLFKGEKADFEIKSIDPPLKSPTKIYTTIDMENIYILEPSEKRIVVIDKLGNLLGQYSSGKFDNLLDFVLDKNSDGKETGKIYLLNGMKIFEIDTATASQ